MEVYKVEIEAPDIDFCWYFIFAKSKESAIKIYEEYSFPCIVEDLEFEKEPVYVYKFPG